MFDVGLHLFTILKINLFASKQKERDSKPLSPLQRARKVLANEFDNSLTKQILPSQVSKALEGALGPTSSQVKHQPVLSGLLKVLASFLNNEKKLNTDAFILTPPESAVFELKKKTQADVSIIEVKEALKGFADLMVIEPELLREDLIEELFGIENNPSRLRVVDEIKPISAAVNGYFAIHLHSLNEIAQDYDGNSLSRFAKTNKMISVVAKNETEAVDYAPLELGDPDNLKLKTEVDSLNEREIFLLSLFNRMLGKMSDLSQAKKQAQLAVFLEFPVMEVLNASHHFFIETMVAEKNLETTFNLLKDIQNSTDFPLSPEKYQESEKKLDALKVDNFKLIQAKSDLLELLRPVILSPKFSPGHVLEILKLIELQDTQKKYFSGELLTPLTNKLTFLYGDIVRSSQENFKIFREQIKNTILSRTVS